MTIASDIKQLKDGIALQIKLQRLDFAYHNSSIDNFIYYTDESYGESQDLVQQIIASFCGGFGNYLYGWTTGESELHKKLCHQFMTLTGDASHRTRRSFWKVHDLLLLVKQKQGLGE